MVFDLFSEIHKTYLAYLNHVLSLEEIWIKWDDNIFKSTHGMIALKLNSSPEKNETTTLLPIPTHKPHRLILHMKLRMKFITSRLINYFVYYSTKPSISKLMYCLCIALLASSVFKFRSLQLDDFK